MLECPPKFSISEKPLWNKWKIQYYLNNSIFVYVCFRIRTFLQWKRAHSFPSHTQISSSWKTKFIRTFFSNQVSNSVDLISKTLPQSPSPCSCPCPCCALGLITTLSDKSFSYFVSMPPILFFNPCSTLPPISGLPLGAMGTVKNNLLIRYH